MIVMMRAAVGLPVNSETIASTISNNERGFVTVFSSWTYHLLGFSRAISFSPDLANRRLASVSVSPASEVSNNLQNWHSGWNYS
jgi:hypothetical protein